MNNIYKLHLKDNYNRYFYVNNFYTVLKSLTFFYTLKIGIH